MASTPWSLLMLALVLALVPLALLALRRLRGARPAGARTLELAGQLALGARERVVLVRLNQRVLVLGVTQQQVTLLAEADAADLPAAGSAAASFPGLLHNVLAGYTGGAR